MNAFDKGDSNQAIHDRHREAEPVIEQQIHGTVAAENQLQGDGADEGRHD